jgi:Transmembrane domain of unknown function (DUF3566)
VSSPNDPGYPRAGDGGGNGSGAGGPAGPERIADPTEVPPWQRGPAARAANRASRQPEAPAAERSAPRGAGSAAGHAPGADARLNRFLSGGAASAPTHEQPAPTRDEWGDPPRQEAYASELPDLSGPTPRPPQRKPASERPAPEPAASRPAPTPSRMQVGTRHQGPVRASMQIRRIDPWSTLKVSLLLSVALFFVWMIAVAFLYLVLGGMGVWSKLNSNVGDLLTSASGSSGGELVSSGTIFGGAALIGLVNIVLLTAMATIGAFIYNLSTDIVGGVEVTLADRD